MLFEIIKLFIWKKKEKKILMLIYAIICTLNILKAVNF